MSSLVIPSIAFALIFLGAMFGMFLQRFLPEHHLENWESRDAVKLGIGLIATMAALVLGLLVSTAKHSFDVINEKVIDDSSKIIMLDRVLARHEPITKEMREQLRHAVERKIKLIWPEDGLFAKKGLETFEQAKALEHLNDLIQGLAPKNEIERESREQAVRLSFEIMESHWFIIEQERNSVPNVLIIVLVFWITTLNVTYGLLAHRNWTVGIVLFFCALSVSASLFLILELTQPLEGIIEVSSRPMHNALDHLGR